MLSTGAVGTCLVVGSILWTDPNKDTRDAYVLWPPQLYWDWLLQQNFFGDTAHNNLTTTSKVLWDLTLRTSIAYCLGVGMTLTFFLAQQIEFAAYVHRVCWYRAGVVGLITESNVKHIAGVLAMSRTSECLLLALTLFVVTVFFVCSVPMVYFTSAIPSCILANFVGFVALVYFAIIDLLF